MRAPVSPLAEPQVTVGVAESHIGAWLPMRGPDKVTLARPDLIAPTGHDLLMVSDHPLGETEVASNRA
jgi:hypothetical protein